MAGKFSGSELYTVATMSDDGRYLAIGSLETIWMWDTHSGELLWSNEQCVAPDLCHIITAATFAKDGASILLQGGVTSLVDPLYPDYIWERKVVDGELINLHSEGSSVFSTDGSIIMNTKYNGDTYGVEVIDVASGDTIHKFSEQDKQMNVGKYNGETNTISLSYDPSQDNSTDLFIPTLPQNRISIYRGQKNLLLTSVAGVVKLWDIDTKILLDRFDSKPIRYASARDEPDEEDIKAAVENFNAARYSLSKEHGYVVTSGYNDQTSLTDPANGSVIRVMQNDDFIFGTTHKVAGDLLLELKKDSATLFNLETGATLSRLKSPELLNEFESINISKNGKFFFQYGGSDVKIWNTSTGQHISSFFPFKGKHSGKQKRWVWMTPDGHFDTDNLDEIEKLNWVFPDEPFRPIPPEMFIQDYFEPHLISKVLHSVQLDKARPLVDINRVQPLVEIHKVEQLEDPNFIEVSVKVKSVVSRNIKYDQKESKRSGVYDLHLFRNGLLVYRSSDESHKDQGKQKGEYDEQSKWRQDSKIIDADKQPSEDIVKIKVEVPSSEGSRKVDLAAYAFNNDRVKSVTHREEFTLDREPKPKAKRAFIISIGVSDSESVYWPLLYAANDANQILDVLSKRLDTEKYSEIVRIPLITQPKSPEFIIDDIERERVRHYISPTKSNIKAVFDILSGNGDKNQHDETTPLRRLAEKYVVGPNDLVVVSISSHGTVDKEGMFYFLPFDVGCDMKDAPTDEMLRLRTISGDQLSEWVGRLDAGEMVMIVDSCHAAAVIEQKGFKPAPLGGRGLGQLSFNKAMMIITATQSTDSAWSLGMSFLTQALVKNGISEGKAFTGGDKTLEKAMEYAVTHAQRIAASEASKGSTYQKPKLFNYGRIRYVKKQHIPLN